jgi:hypothetical protein
MRVPTIRVANPCDPANYMTINACDITPAHEVWPEQPEAPETVALSPAGEGEATIATRVVSKMLCRRAGISLGEWRALPAEERLRQVMAAEAEVDAASAQVVEAGESALSDVRYAKGPGGKWFGWRGDERVTKGHPTEAEARAEFHAAGA